MKKNSLVGPVVLLAMVAIGSLMNDAIAQEAPSLQQQLQSIQQQPPVASVALPSENTVPNKKVANPLGVTVPSENPLLQSMAAPPANTMQNPLQLNQAAPNPVTSMTPPSPITPPVVVRSGAPPVSAGLSGIAGAASAPSIEDNIRDEAFARMATSSLPLSPTQIEVLRNLYDATQRAAAGYPGTPPRPTVASVAVNLAPGLLRPLSG